MLSGIQSLISDSFGQTINAKDSSQLLKQLKMGDYEIMFEKGKYITLIVIYKGYPGKRLPKILSQLVTSMETKHATALSKWDGKYSSIKGIEEIAEPYLSIEEKSNKKE